MQHVKRFMIMLLCIFLIGITITGCLGKKAQPEPEQFEPGKQEQEDLEYNPEELDNESLGNPNPDYPDSQNRVKQIKLYFVEQTADDMYLVPEMRDVMGGNIENSTHTRLSYEQIIKKLIAGPQREDLEAIIPPGTALIDTRESDNIVAVNFNDAIKTQFRGGSRTEQLLVYSIVNTLTEYRNVDKVQILINGKKVESIGGHIDISKPLERDTSMVKSQKE